MPSPRSAGSQPDDQHAARPRRPARPPWPEHRRPGPSGGCRARRRTSSSSRSGSSTDTVPGGSPRARVDEHQQVVARRAARRRGARRGCRSPRRARRRARPAGQPLGDLAAEAVVADEDVADAGDERPGRHGAARRSTGSTSSGWKYRNRPCHSSRSARRVVVERSPRRAASPSTSGTRPRPWPAVRRGTGPGRRRGGDRAQPHLGPLGRRRRRRSTTVSVHGSTGGVDRRLPPRTARRRPATGDRSASRGRPQRADRRRAGARRSPAASRRQRSTMAAARGVGAAGLGLLLVGQRQHPQREDLVDLGARRTGRPGSPGRLRVVVEDDRRRQHDVVVARVADRAPGTCPSFVHDATAPRANSGGSSDDTNEPSSTCEQRVHADQRAAHRRRRGASPGRPTSVTFSTAHLQRRAPSADRPAHGATTRADHRSRRRTGRPTSPPSPWCSESSSRLAGRCERRRRRRRRPAAAGRRRRRRPRARRPPPTSPTPAVADVELRRRARSPPPSPPRPCAPAPAGTGPGRRAIGARADVDDAPRSAAPTARTRRPRRNGAGRARRTASAPGSWPPRPGTGTGRSPRRARRRRPAGRRERGRTAVGASRPSRRPPASFSSSSKRLVPASAWPARP